MAKRDENDVAADDVADDEEEQVRPRAIWSGTISFGLVSIPIELFPGNRRVSAALRMVADDGTPLARRFFCPKEDREIDYDDLVRGYEIEKDKYVVITADEFEKLAPERTRDIELKKFVKADDIDPVFFDRSYYLVPGGTSTRAYRLLAATMEKTGLAGIATFVMREREYLVAILADNGILSAQTMRFTSQMRSPDEIGLPAVVEPPAAAVKEIERAIAKLSKEKFSERELTDRSAERLLDLVAKKEKRGEGVVEAAGEEAGPGAIIDLMEVLKARLEGKEVGEPEGAARKTTRKTAGTSTGKSVRKSVRKSTGKPARKSTGKSARKSTGTVVRKRATRTGARKSGGRSSRKRVRRRG